MRGKDKAVALLREIQRRRNHPAEVERREAAYARQREQEAILRQQFEAPIRADERAKVIEELAALAEAWPFGKDGHLWQGHEKRDFGRWLRKQDGAAS
jgi:hypothetical protein